MKKGYKHHTFLLGVELKEDFKEECENNGTKMSPVLEIMMKSYINSSKKIRNG